MNLHQLNSKPVHVIPHKDVFGRTSMIQFAPKGKGGHGWSWSPTADPSSQSPITLDSVRCNPRFRNIEISHPSGKKLRIGEHILALRWLGLQDINIIAPNSWPPYLTTAEMWTHLASSVHDTGKPLRWQTCEETVEWVYPKPRGGIDAFVKVEPLGHPTFRAEIRVSYEGLGTWTERYDLAAMPRERLLDIMSVGPQGWYWLRDILKLVFPKWVHMNRVVWPDFSSDSAKRWTLKKYCDHRFVDLLGAAALLGIEGKGYLPAVNVTSHAGGHEGDLLAFRKVNLNGHKFR